MRNKSKAIALPQDQRYATLSDVLRKAVGFMYGDRRRTEITIAVAFGMLIIAKMLLEFDHVQRYACVG